MLLVFHFHTKIVVYCQLKNYISYVNYPINKADRE